MPNTALTSSLTFRSMKRSGGVVSSGLPRVPLGYTRLIVLSARDYGDALGIVGINSKLSRTYAVYLPNGSCASLRNCRPPYIDGVSRHYLSTCIFDVKLKKTKDGFYTTDYYVEVVEPYFNSTNPKLLETFKSVNS